jgi:hypothetical protein
MSEQWQTPGQEQQGREGEPGQEAGGVDSRQLYEGREPSPAARRVNALFDDMESKQIDNVNESGRALIERIATFLGVLFGISVLSNNFPPSYLKGNTPVKALLIVALAGYLLAIGAALWATQVRYYQRYTYNASRSQAEMARVAGHKLGWLRAAHVLFALGTVALAALLITIVWNM